MNSKQEKILSILDKDARLSHSKISQLCGVPKSVVTYNINQLIQTQIIKGFTTLIDHSALGFVELRGYITTYDTNIDKEKKFIDYLKKLKNTGVVVKSAGDYSIVVSFYTNNLSNFWVEWFDILKLHKEVINKYFFNIIIEKQMFPFFADIQKRTSSQFIIGNKKAQEIDDTDKKLIDFLTKNCRQPIHEMANALNLKSSSIIYRIKRLESKNIILGYYTIFDLSKLNKEYCRVHFQFDNLLKFDNLILNLKSTSQVLSFAKTIGAGNELEVDFVVDNLDELIKTINNFREKFPGLIRGYKYFRIIDIYKWNHKPNF